MKARITALILLIFGVAIGYFVYTSEMPGAKFPFHYGLDLDGGTSLTYTADTSSIPPEDVEGAMNTLRNTIERRVNIFGVSEPVVLVEKGSVFGDDANQNRLVVELPGVTDVTEAINAIGQTPLLEFKLQKDGAQIAVDSPDLLDVTSEEELLARVDELYTPTGLTGGQLKRAQLVFAQLHGGGTSGAIVQIQFNDEGSKLFADITRDNVGSSLAIFLDGKVISSPVIQQEIIGGTAQITGQFSAEEARDLVQNLNFGALPLPIDLLETQTIGASLGHETLNEGVSALLYAFAIIFVFLLIWYRLPGLLASVSLLIYIVIMLALFKLIPVTLTSSGLAGFILSLGMAVDANILVFERVKEELRGGRSLRDAVEEGFKRAWLPIRDGNLSSVISASVLFWLSGTSLVKGFALVFGIGVVVSMLTAVTISRTFLLAFSNEKTEGLLVKLFGAGFGFKKVTNEK